MGNEFNFGIEFYVCEKALAFGVYPFFWRFGFRSFLGASVIAAGPFRIEMR